VKGASRTNRDVTDGRVLIDAERKAKQIMIIIKDTDSSMINTDILKEKANGILVKIKGNDHPKTVEVETIIRVFNGGTLLHLNSKEAAKWIKDPIVEEDFFKKFAKDAYIKECPHNILLQGVPITFDPGNENHLREIKEANRLIKYSLLRAKWIKPEGRRCTGQTHAHATASIFLASTANRLIKEGLDIFGIKIRPERLKQEPLQCLWC
jgi:hypothetical protein